jgi:hypothetical protein
MSDSTLKFAKSLPTWYADSILSLFCGIAVPTAAAMAAVVRDPKLVPEGADAAKVLWARKHGKVLREALFVTKRFTGLDALFDVVVRLWIVYKDYNNNNNNNNNNTYLSWGRSAARYIVMLESYPELLQQLLLYKGCYSKTVAADRVSANSQFSALGSSNSRDLRALPMSLL